VVDVTGDRAGSGILGSGGRARDTTLDVIIPASDGPTVAALAADDALVVAVLPGQSGS
jgi:hypothetical protein